LSCSWKVKGNVSINSSLKALVASDNSDEIGRISVLAEKAKSRSRLATTLNHKQPDRIPIDFGGTMCTGIHVSCVAALRDYYGLEKRLVRVHEPLPDAGIHRR
jgi:hypothetical protein